jgi:hypothetical protein
MRINIDQNIINKDGIKAANEPFELTWGYRADLESVGCNINYDREMKKEITTLGLVFKRTRITVFC